MLPVLVLVGLGLACGAGWKYRRKKNVQPARWPATKGRVISATLIRMRDRDGQMTAEPRITYEYTVNRQVYRSTRVKFGFKPRATLTVARYPAGNVVDVYYNPVKPEDAVLERETAK
jgi:LPXTG-motif cell wall-anchored protein